MSSDSITLSIPQSPPFHGVARLVVGGLAARLDLSYEHLEDLQLALASVLENDDYLVEPSVTVRLSVEAGSVGMEIGPVQPRLRADLEPGGDAEDGLPIRRLLSTLVDEIALEGEGGEEWLRLEKHVPTRKPEARG
jgi:anti-sigma regulatory factor (Ser/Thr protein kinase)